jgi:hypothetical protein
MSATEPAPGGVAAQESGAPAVPAPPVYADVEGFVVGFLAPTIARKLVSGGRGLTWCPQWWMHAEAIARLMALWEAWEALRLDGGTAMGTWWRDHCGPQLGVLMNGEEGPLHLCKPDHHGGIPAPLKSAPAPPDWWGPAQS